MAGAANGFWDSVGDAVLAVRDWLYETHIGVVGAERACDHGGGQRAGCKSSNDAPGRWLAGGVWNRGESGWRKRLTRELGLPVLNRSTRPPSGEMATMSRLGGVAIDGGL